MNSPAPGRTVFSCAPAGLAAAAAGRIVAMARAALPDLSSHVVLVPDLHAASAFAAALRAAAGTPVLLLPRITTLAALAATVPVGRPVASPAARELSLQMVLAERGWLRDADLWAVAAELADLFEELTRWKVGLPSDLDDFAHRLAAAYGAIEGDSLRFEARLVHALWYASATGTSDLSAEAACQIRLGTLASAATAPLWAVGLGRLAPAEEDFLARYAERAPVVELRADAGPASPIEHALACAWPRAVVPPVRDRAQALAVQFAANPLAGRIAFFGAGSVEEEAQAIDTAVRRWLLAGCRSIGVVVLDRVVARRARALLERAGVLVEDEAGWAFSTTSAATVVGRLLDVVSGDCHHRDLLDLLKSPFAFGDRPRDERRSLVWRLEQCVRKAGVVSGLDHCRVAVQRFGDEALVAQLDDVGRAIAELGRGRRSLAGWLGALDAALGTIGVTAAFAADAAGEQLNALIESLRREVAGYDQTMGYGDFRRWLARVLERATFRDRAIESPVVFTHLAATRLRRFDAVLFAGCDAAHLPGSEGAAMFFNQGVRAELGLPTRIDEIADIERTLAALIAGSGEVLVTWQRSVGGDGNLLSPIFERLRTVSRMAWGDDLAETTLGRLAAVARVEAPGPRPVQAATVCPAPAVPASLVPTEISASGYNSLLACPYQFYARHVLRLGGIDEVEETVDKREFGVRLHRALAAFHARHPAVSDLDPAQAESELVAMSEAVFTDALARDYLSAGWLVAWRALVPDYLAWQRSREAAGWRWRAAEERRRVDFDTPAGRGVALIGRLDRVDAGAQGVAVIDYKTTSRESLQRRAGEPGEDVQLAVYALLHGGPVAQALYVTIDRDGVHEVPLDTDLAALAADCRERLLILVDAIHDGARLPAQGTDAECTYCDMQGALPTEPLAMSLPPEVALNRAALEPQKSVVIEACAGSGKTWLLVSRIVRLMLAGAKPAEILAITFTRKAAQEMAARLREWLELLATADDDTVRAFLREREVPPADVDALLPRARGLHEAFLTAQPSVTLSTFHSWFMQLLRRAPLDAGAPGDVTLVEQTSTFVAEAWQLFGRSARRTPDGPAARGLDHLHGQCGVDGTRRLLERFLNHRADWWALTVGHQGGAAVAHALAGLRATMRVAPDDDVPHLLVTESRFAADLVEYVRMLARNTPTEQARAAAYPAGDGPAAVFAWAREALLKKDGDPRSVKPSAAQRKRLGGDVAESAFIGMHARLVDRLLAALQDLADQASYRLNEAALHAGAELLDAYQRAKAQRQVIDYADVEWRACELVARSDHALYMQFKLDARYRHVLLDEFQDTNPLQWITLEAWFGAAAEAGLHPTVFLVGDPKQSIYRFRRAEPRLFDAAALWLKERFGAARLTQDASRRCAPQIIGMVNRVFAGLAGYNEHTAHYTALPGRVEVLPLVARAPNGNGAADLPEALRNPLQSPRNEVEDGRREEEALQMAQRIGGIVARWHVVDDAHAGTTRPARYSDVMVLVRRRTHLAVYERALRHAAIPFVTSRQGGLLDTLEACDLLALLRFLVSPFDDLSLAHALRSPVFGCDDTDLQALAAVREGTWWERLQRLAGGPACSAALARACRLLAGLLARADTLPVHDQLDRLYFEADVIARYEAAVPAAMRATVTANLRAFMQHALDTDSGRYPSLPRFIDELRDLAQAPAEEAPDEGIVGDVGDAVRILTVHGAKGLEAPIVWLPDTAAGVVRDQGYDVVVDWPPEASAPTHLSVRGRQDARSGEQRRIAEVERDRAARENSNLLYVAITRARQALIVSGVDTRGADASWYRRLRDAAAAGAGMTDDDGSAPVIVGADLEVDPAAEPAVPAPVGESLAAIDSRMTAPLPTGARRDTSTTRGQRYGTLFHAVMECLTQAPDTGQASLREMLGIADAELAPLYAQARRLLRSPDLAPFFDPGCYVRALNELPYADESGVLRRIDRLVEHTDAWWVLDYKTGQATAVRGTPLEQQYREQVAEYCVAMRRISGGKVVRGVVLFTDGGRIDVEP